MPEILAEVHWLEGHLANKRGSLDDGIAAFEKALGEYRALGDPAGIGLSLYGLGELCKLRGDLSACIAHYEDAIATLEESGDFDTAGSCLSGLSDAYRRLGDYQRSLDQNTSSLTHLRRIGNMHDVAIALNNRGDIFRYLCDLERAETHYREAAELFHAQGSGDAAITKINLAIVLIERAKYREARSILELAESDLEAQNRGGYLSFVHAHMLPCLVSEGDWDGWQHHYQRLVYHLAKTQLVDDDLARPLELAGDLCLEAKQPHWARDAYELALQQWRKLGRDDAVRELEARSRRARIRAQTQRNP